MSEMLDRPLKSVGTVKAVSDHRAWVEVDGVEYSLPYLVGHRPEVGEVVAIAWRVAAILNTPPPEE